MKRPSQCPQLLWQPGTPAAKTVSTFSVKLQERHLLEHDLVGTLDKVLPNRLSNLGVAVDEMVSPENVHGSHIVNGGKLLRQASVTVKKLRMATNSEIISGK